MAIAILMCGGIGASGCVGGVRSVGMMVGGGVVVASKVVVVGSGLGCGVCELYLGWCCDGSAWDGLVVGGCGFQI